jgi:simple sugar transport system ATP-binding protein
MQGITMTGITKDFFGKLALQDVDLTIKKGTVHAIVGENGAGKSTLMNILSGTLPPTTGEIVVDGKKAILRGPQDAAKYSIGMVYQHFMLIPSLTVWQNVVLGSEPLKHGYTIDKATAIERITKTCETYGIDLNPERIVGDLTVGEQQRIEILKVLMRDAEYLILDEPTAVLTPQETEQLCDNIRALKKMGKTIIFISHKLEEVMDVADEITVLRLGHLIGTIPVSEATTENLVQMMVGRDVQLEGYPMEVELGDVVLRVEDVCTERSQFSSGLQDITFNLRAGEVLGIAGVDGNGQTELVDAILGIDRVSSGKIEKSGVDITGKSSSWIRNSGLALIPPDRHTQGLVLQNSILMNSVLGCETDKRICKNGLLRKRKLTETMSPLLKEFDVRMPSVEAKVSELSGGNQQKVILAREFGIRDSELVIAVNPTRGLDIGAIEFVYKRLEEQKAAGKAVLLISTELTEIMRMSDRIAVFFKGRCMDIIPRDQADVNHIGRLMMGIKEGGDSE